MGETLNMDRLLLGIKYEISKIPKKIIYFILVLIGVHILECLLFVGFNERGYSYRNLEDLLILYNSYFSAYIKIGLLLIIFITRDNNDAPSFIHYFSSPLSNLEKYLAKWLTSYVFYTFVFHIAYYLLHLAIWMILSSRGTYLEMPPLFSFDNIGLIVVLGIINSISIYVCALFPRYFNYIIGAFVFFVWFTIRKYLPIALSFLSTDNPYLYSNYILVLLGLLALPLGYYAIKNQQYSTPRQSKLI